MKKTEIMMSRVVLLFLILVRYQVWSRVPSKESLCVLIVDLDIQNQCLNCFTEAGPIQQNPEGFRICVASYLPPLLAECAIPHPTNDLDRIQQYKPDIHHNHTNANLLPNCLKRRRRMLSRYLQKENRFTEQAGQIVKTVVTSRLIDNGGPNMLSLASMFYILQDQAVQDLVKVRASSCFESTRTLSRFFEFSDALRHGNDSEESNEDDEEESSSEESREEGTDQDNDDDKRDLASLFSMEEEEGDEEEKDVDDVVGEEASFLRDGTSPNGNGLPYGGTNALSADMVLGKCIIDALIQNRQGLHLISLISKDEFFYPIPSMWVEPLLRYYKALREALENDETGRSGFAKTL